MAHLRQQIREAITTRLTGLSTTGSNVFELDIKPIQDNRLPALLIHTPADIPNYEDGAMGCKPRHELEVVVEGKYKGATQSVLDDIAEEVETAIYSDDTFGGLAVGTELAGQEINLDIESEKPIGSINLTFTVYYNAVEGVPDTAA